MSHDGLPVRAGDGARAARADRRASSGRTSTRRHLAIAAELLAIVALLAAACNASSSSAGVAGATATPSRRAASVEPSVEASVAPSAPARLAIVFNQANASKVFGGGVLNDLGDGSTAVTLGVVAIGFTDPMPAKLESGACADLATVAPSGAPAASGSPAASAGASAAASAPAASGGATAPAASPTATPGPVTGPPFVLNPVNGGSSNTIIQADARRPDRGPVRDRAQQVGRRPDGRGLRRRDEHPGRRVLVVGGPGGVRSGRVASGGVGGAVRLLTPESRAPAGSDPPGLFSWPGFASAYRPLYEWRPLNQSEPEYVTRTIPNATTSSSAAGRPAHAFWFRAWR